MYDFALMEALRLELNQAGYEYYVLDNPTMSDYDYDHKLRQLEEEDPQLHIVWNESLREIRIQLMGEVQLEILQRVIRERFGMEVSFGTGAILYKETIKGITYKIFEGYLSYKPSFCPSCGVVFDEKFEKHGFILSNIKIPDVSGYKAILRLHKQRYLCKHCHKAFTLTSNITNYGCFISNQVKYAIALELKNKISEVDIAKRYRVSPNTVERIIDSYYDGQKLYKHHLPG